MHKFRIIPVALLMSLMLGSGLTAFTNSNSAFAQNFGYDNTDYLYDNNNSYSDSSSYEDSYSSYPTEDRPYECQTGPLEGFFTSSVEFCKNVNFEYKDKKILEIIIKQERKAPQAHKIQRVIQEQLEQLVTGSTRLDWTSGTSRNKKRQCIQLLFSNWQWLY